MIWKTHLLKGQNNTPYLVNVLRTFFQWSSLNLYQLSAWFRPHHFQWYRSRCPTSFVFSHFYRHYLTLKYPMSVVKLVKKPLSIYLFSSLLLLPPTVYFSGENSAFRFLYIGHFQNARITRGLKLSFWTNIVTS